MENSWQKIKNMLDAREVVKYYLGEPDKKSGNSHKWKSPFRNGDSDPSLSANEIAITDFGGDFKGDIFKFVSEYKMMSKEDALEQLVCDFDLDIKLTQKKKNKKSSKIELSEIESENEVKVMIDSKQFQIKPSGPEIGGIKKRIKDLEVESYTYARLQELIRTGHSIVPSGIAKNSEFVDDETGMQVFMIDIDNAMKIHGEKEEIYVEDERHIDVDKAVKFCESKGLIPSFIYYTLSHSDKQHKFRLVYIFDEPIKNSKIITDIIEKLFEELKELNIDTSTKDISRIFLGGKEIGFDSKKYYTFSYQEIDEETEEDEEEDNEYNRKLKYSKYRVLNGKLCVKSKNEAVQVSNFISYIQEQITHNNGKEKYTTYKVGGEILYNREKLPTIEVTKQELESFSFILNEKWNIKAIIAAGSGNKDRMREVAQIISKDNMKASKVFTHTGFIKENGKLLYLYNGGVIGDATDIKINLENDGLGQYHFKDKEYVKIEDAVFASYSILEVAPMEISIPLIAMAYIAPLTSILKEENIFADFIMWIEGKTGTRKSSITAMLMSHFGDFTRNNFPSSFRDTLNSIEKKAFILKDTINVIDDFNPEINNRNKIYLAEKIFGMYGDRAGRDRMQKDGVKLMNPYVARGLCIVTGETLPELPESRLARAVVVNIEKDSVNLTELSKLQNSKELLNLSMKTYIEWIIKEEENVRRFIKTNFDELQQEDIGEGIHGRTKESISILYIGFCLFLKHVERYNIIEKETEELLKNEAKKIFKDLITNQAESIEETNPVEMFIAAIEQLYLSRKIYINEYKDYIFESPAGSTVVGYEQGSDYRNVYYFLPDLIYKEVVKFYREQGIKFPISKSTLWKYLDQEKYLYRTEKSTRRTVRKRAPNGGKGELVLIAIFKDKFSIELSGY